MGRIFGPEDDGTVQQPTLVLSYGYWQSAFAGEPDAIGKVIRLNGVPFTVAGVAERRFNRLSPGNAVDVWLPLAFGPTTGYRLGTCRPLGDDHEWWLKLIARRKPGISQARVEAELTTLLFQNEMIYRAKLLKAGQQSPNRGDVRA